jgi:RimK family alpha-L-glutamate ligase
MKKTKIAVFFGGKISKHLVLVREAARKMGVELDLVSYNQVCFETETGKISLRGKDASDYDVLFFRTTGKHWEEVDLIINSITTPKASHLGGQGPVVVDPLVRFGKPSYACKAWQMLKLKEAGIEVPKSIYGSLWYLYETMAREDNSHQRIFSSGESAKQAQCQEKLLASNYRFSFPVILKGSGGDRGTRVFKANNLEELEKLVRDLRKTETEEGRRYMLQEYIKNDGDYRVIVLGEKVLGVMKRSSQNKSEFRNNYSAGGKVEVADLPDEIKRLAVKAAKVCGLAVAGVDVMAKNPSGLRPAPLNGGAAKEMSDNPKDYVILEVNKGPQFSGFMKATGIDVPREIVKYLVSLRNKTNKLE